MTGVGGLVAIVLCFIGFAGVEAQFTTYAVGALGVSGGLAGLLLGGFSLAFVAASLPAGPLGTRLGKARAMGLGLAALPVFFLVLAVVRSAPPTAAVIAPALAGAAMDAFGLPVLFPLAAAGIAAGALALARARCSGVDSART